MDRVQRVGNWEGVFFFLFGQECTSLLCDDDSLFSIECSSNQFALVFGGKKMLLQVQSVKAACSPVTKQILV